MPAKPITEVSVEEFDAEEIASFGSAFAEEPECFVGIKVNGHSYAVFVPALFSEACGGGPTEYGEQIVNALVNYPRDQAELVALRQRVADLTRELDTIHLQIMSAP